METTHEKTLVVKPSWQRIPQFELTHGLKRAFFYSEVLPEVESVLLAKAGSKKGCRLVNVESVEAWIRKHLETPSPEPQS